MALAHSPSIVTDGLVLCLDAANTKSYPGSGATWTDLSGKSSAVSLVNLPTFTSSNTGAIVFNGTTQYADLSVTGISTVCTVEFFAYFTDLTNRMPFGWNQYDVFSSTSGLGYNTGSGDTYGFSAAQVTALGLLNNWRHYAFVMRTDVSYTNNKIYVDTVSQSLSQQAGSEISARRTFNGGVGKICGWVANGSYRMPMSLAGFKVYNKELSADEILQNFNAHRGRFGV